MDDEPETDGGVGDAGAMEEKEIKDLMGKINEIREQLITATSLENPIATGFELYEVEQKLLDVEDELYERMDGDKQ